MVDDGSPDKAGEICDKYSSQDKKIITIHQENKGQIAARTAGNKYILDNLQPDSFHGSAFSINYNKDFFVFGNPDRGNSRFDSLLSLFSLKHRMVETINSDIQPINWEEVNQKLNSERNRCYEWLERAIG